MSVDEPVVIDYQPPMELADIIIVSGISKLLVEDGNIAHSTSQEGVYTINDGKNSRINADITTGNDTFKNLVVAEVRPGSAPNSYRITAYKVPDGVKLTTATIDKAIEQAIIRQGLKDRVAEAIRTRQY